MDGQALTEHQREAAQADLLRFTALNALSFEILAGQILILFARQVGASLADIGLLAALLPFASVIQLGIPPLINRFGPRALMLAGWGARTAVAAALLLVPAAGDRGGPEAATGVLLLVMGGFYLCRAVGMSSWLPMLQEIVRPQDRGLYLSRQEWLRQVSIVLIAVVTALYLLGAPGVTRYLHIIAVGVAAAAWSLYYLGRVPNVGATDEPVDRDYFKRAMAPMRDGLFRRYLFFSVTLRMVLSAFSPFLIVFLREGLHLPASGVIAVNTVSSLGAIATLSWWGRWSDRVGAKPALAVSIAGVAFSLVLWVFTGPIDGWLWTGIPAVALLLGIFTGGLTVSMSRFELGFIPIEGRAHYVASNVTAVGLSSGIAAFAAGWFLQALRNVSLDLTLLTLDRYRLFFVLSAALLAIPLVARMQLPEERSRSVRALMRREIHRRSRRLRRLLGRGRAR
jgi:MFS family permease